MNVEALKDLIQVLRISPKNLAKTIGVTELRLKRVLNQNGDVVISDEVLLKAIVDGVPDIILERIQKMHHRLERLRKFGPVLHSLKGDLQDAERQKEKEVRFEEKFGEGRVQVDPSLSQQEVCMVKELESGGTVVDKRTTHD